MGEGDVAPGASTVKTPPVDDAGLARAVLAGLALGLLMALARGIVGGLVNLGGPVLIGIGVGYLSRRRSRGATLLALLPGCGLFVLAVAILNAVELAARAGGSPDGAVFLGAVAGGLQCGGVMAVAVGVPAALVARRL